jgi:hypothetical protein
MIRDLRTILEGWEYEAGKISVRKIIGREGREKLQTRIDLGVLQMEINGRPDGERPHGFESLLEYHEQRLIDHVCTGGSDDEYLLSPEDCRDLRQESYLYYQRYLSCFVLEDFEAVERDTARNLRAIDLCARYAVTPDDRGALLPQRAYVQMMNTRARAYRALQMNRFESALGIVDGGVSAIRTQSTEDAQGCNEVNVLLELRSEILRRMPVTAPARLQAELDAALANEEYERAAEIRDRLEAGARQHT